MYGYIRPKQKYALYYGKGNLSNKWVYIEAIINDDCIVIRCNPMLHRTDRHKEVTYVYQCVSMKYFETSAEYLRLENQEI